MKVSKVVLIVVALHVLVIGGIFIFEGCSRTKVQAPDMAENETPATDTNTTANAGTPTTPDVANLTPATPTNAVSAINPTPIAPVGPGTTVASRTHVVAKGETIAKIAKAEKVTASELLKANNLTKTSMLKIGQKLTIPGKAEAATAVAAATPVTPAMPTATDGTTYTVKSGDSLWKIAHAHKVTVAAIKQANNLTGDSLKANQKLVIPGATATATAAAAAPVASGALAATDAGTGQTHEVEVGETLGVIAKKFGVKVADLMKANNISDPKRLQAGRKLTIPTVASAAPAAPAPVPATTPAMPAAPTTTSLTPPTVSSAPIVATTR